MGKVEFWINNARHIALPQSVLPALLAISMGAQYESFSWWMAIVALFGIICAHLGMNLADDYFDYQVGTGEKREQMASDGIRARIAKYHYLTSGQATVAQLRNTIIIFLLIAVACSIVIMWFRGWPILVFMLIGGFLGISYSGWPLKLSYYGYGELVIGLMFGVFLMIGMQYAVCGVLDWSIVLMSISVGMLVTNIVYSHSIMDRASDEKVDKKTFAILLDTPKRELAASACLNLLPFVLVFAGVAFGSLSVGYLIVVILMPIALRLWKSLWRFVYGEDEDMTLKPWMGPMGDWNDYVKAGIDWFMFRWLMARNLVTFFCLLLIIINIVMLFI